MSRLLAVLLVSTSVLALDPNKRLTQYVFDTWSAASGLPQNSVQGINQTHLGYLWFGTQEGLVRFDGVEFDVFDKFNVASMSSNLVNTTSLDDQGYIWYSTDLGEVIRLNTMDHSDNLRMHQFERGIITFIHVQGKQAWVATAGSGVCLLGGDQPQFFNQENGLPHNSVWWMGSSVGGGVVACTNGGLASIEDGILKPLGPRKATWSITQRSEGGYWVGTVEGLYVFDNDTYTPVPIRPENEPAIYTVMEDRDGCVWAGTPRDGIFRICNARVEQFNEQQGLPYNSILSLFEDHEGSIWAGTDGGGLVRFRDASVTAFSTTEGLPNDMVRSVLSDREGRLWIGMDGGGVAWLEDPANPVLSRVEGLTDDRVLAVNQDNQGGIWISTYGGGLNFFDGDSLVAYGVSDGLPTLRTGTVIQTRDGAIWIGTQLGLVSLIQGVMRTYTTVDGLTSNLIRNLHESRDGTLWIATRGGGLNAFRDGKFSALTEADGLSSNQILAIYEHENGDLWVGTSDQGLNLVRKGEIVVVDRKKGLFDDKILEILYDRRGRFWMSSNRGIFSVLVSDLYDLVDGKTDQVTCRVLRADDGMKSSECNGGSAPAGTVDPNGVIWFPTIKGVVRIDPAALVINPVPPMMTIKQVIADGEVLDVTENMSLPSTISKLEIKFAALSLRVPDRVGYKYRFKGHGDEWKDMKGRRSVVLTNLKGGDYTFEVLGCNDSGVWSEQPARINFRFVLPWYQKAWFRLLVGMGLLAIIWRSYTARQQKMGRRESQLANLIEARASGLRESSRRLIDAQDQMVEAAHRAGMAEIAKSVLGQVRDALTQVDEASKGLVSALDSVSVPTRMLRLSEQLGQIDQDRLHYLKETETGKQIIKELLALPEHVPDQRRRLLDEISAITKRFQQLNRLISAQQDFVKLERVHDQIDINQIVLDALKMKSDLIHEHGIEIIQDLAPLSPIQGRRSLMLKALINMIQNSCEAIESSHVVKKTIRVRSFKDRLGIHVELSDTGPGIAEADRDRIFSQGFTTKPGRAGLGLHTTANAIAQLGGVIRVVNGDHPGTHIRISFYNTNI